MFAAEDYCAKEWRLSGGRRKVKKAEHPPCPSSTAIASLASIPPSRCALPHIYTNLLLRSQRLSPPPVDPSRRRRRLATATRLLSVAAPLALSSRSDPFPFRTASFLLRSSRHDHASDTLLPLRRFLPSSPLPPSLARFCLLLFLSSQPLFDILCPFHTKVLLHNTGNVVAIKKVLQDRRFKVGGQFRRLWFCSSLCHTCCSEGLGQAWEAMRRNRTSQKEICGRII